MSIGGALGLVSSMYRGGVGGLGVIDMRRVRQAIVRGMSGWRGRMLVMVGGRDGSGGGGSGRAVRMARGG